MDQCCVQLFHIQLIVAGQVQIRDTEQIIHNDALLRVFGATRLDHVTKQMAHPNIWFVWLQCI